MERVADLEAYVEVFADMPTDLNLDPLLEGIQRHVDALGGALEDVTALVETLLGDQSTLLEALPALLAAVGEDPSGAIGVLQAALAAQLADLAGSVLPVLIAIVSKIAAPTCYTLGALTTALPEATEVLPLDETTLGPLAPLVKDLDRGVDDALYNLYVELFARLLAPVELPAGAALPVDLLTIAQTLLSVLKVDMETTYYNADDEPFVRSTPGLLGLPVLLDVDGRLGFDMCAITSVDTAELAAGKVGVSQSISRMPLRKKPLRST